MSCYSTFTLEGLGHRDEMPAWLIDATQRFAAKYEAGRGGCWQWTGWLSGGYGTFHVNGRRVAAHRFAYERYVGPVGNGLVLDHLCRNRGCVNPGHVEPVTPGENIRRGLTGYANAVKTHCPRNHEYTPENTYVIPRSGGRTCRTCQKRRSREYEERRRPKQLAPSEGWGPARVWRSPLRRNGTGPQCPVPTTEEKAGPPRPASLGKATPPPPSASDIRSAGAPTDMTESGPTGK